MAQPKKDKEFAKKRNEVADVSLEIQEQKMDLMIKDFPKYLDKRATQFTKELKKYVDDHSQSGVFIPDDLTKMPFLELKQHTFQPIIRVAGVSPTYSADQMAIALDFYSNCTLQMNNYGIYVPKVPDFCRMMNISTVKFYNYKNSSNDERMREVCAMVEDYCASFVDDAGLGGQVDSKYAQFHQKSSNSRRDSDPPQNNTFIQNNTVMDDKQLYDLEKKYINNV